MARYGFGKIKITLQVNEEEQWLWNSNSPTEYQEIKEGIRLCIDKGFNVETFSLMTPQNYRQLEPFYKELKELGVSKARLLRLMPVGNSSNAPDSYIIGSQELEELIGITDRLKDGRGPYISFGEMFGPDFYGSSVWGYLDQENGKPGKQSDWTRSKTLCPAIDGNYLGVSAKSRNAYWCFFLISDPAAKVGRVEEDGMVKADSMPDLSRATLTEKLRGICSKDSCEFQAQCLGGCRAMAYVMAKRRGEPDPLYAGMDICRTDVKKRMGAKLK